MPEVPVDPKQQPFLVAGKGPVPLPPLKKQVWSTPLLAVIDVNRETATGGPGPGSDLDVFSD